jgi:hypothetical protein
MTEDRYEGRQFDRGSNPDMTKVANLVVICL